MIPHYEIVEVRDASHVAAKRRSANVVISPDDMAHAREVLLKVVSIIRLPGVKCAEGRQWSYADIVLVFLWSDPSAVGVTGAVARAMFTHKDLDERFVPSFPATDVVKVKGGTVRIVL